MNERRKHHRLDIGIKFIYKIMGVKGESPVYTLDVSGGGLRFYVKEKLDIGTLLELGLHSPFADEIMFALAKVVWQKSGVKKSPQAGVLYETGLVFVNIDINHRMRLIQFIQNKLREKRKNAL